MTGRIGRDLLDMTLHLTLQELSNFLWRGRIAVALEEQRPVID